MTSQTDPETLRNKDLKYDKEKRTRTFQNSWIDKIPWVVLDEKAQEMSCIGDLELINIHEEYRSVQDVYYRS
jgi:hypothetical protein